VKQSSRATAHLIGVAQFFAGEVTGTWTCSDTVRVSP